MIASHGNKDEEMIAERVYADADDVDSEEKVMDASANRCEWKKFTAKRTLITADGEVITPDGGVITAHQPVITANGKKSAPRAASFLVKPYLAMAGLVAGIAGLYFQRTQSPKRKADTQRSESEYKAGYEN